MVLAEETDAAALMQRRLDRVRAGASWPDLAAEGDTSARAVVAYLASAA